jgi:hypothetical protein
MRIWRKMARGLFVLLAGGLCATACYHDPYAYGYGYGHHGGYCRRVWVHPYYGHAGYWRCA